MSLVKLLCLSPYRSNVGEFQPGIIEVEAELAEFLRRDAPGVFEEYNPAKKLAEAKAEVEAEVKEKQVKRPAEDKAVKPRSTSRKRG